MLKVILTKGAPASGKSTWAKAEVAKDPDNWARINNDDIRAMLNGSVYSSGYEKFVSETRDMLIRNALKHNKSVIIDNVNANKLHFDTCVKIAKSLNIDAIVMEMPFFQDLEVLLERDAKREGKAKVGEAVIKKFWKELGGHSFKNYVAKTELISSVKNTDKDWQPMVQDASQARAIIVDNDGTICRIHSGRSPYDASTCDLDIPQDHVIECVKLYYKAGYKVLFVSGREEKDRAPTERFYQKYLPEVKYQLFMRQTGDLRKDVIIKEEIFNNHIKNKYYVAAWFDDRLQVSKWVHQMGLPLFRVNDPEANF